MIVGEQHPTEALRRHDGCQRQRAAPQDADARQEKDERRPRDGEEDELRQIARALAQRLSQQDVLQSLGMNIADAFHAGGGFHRIARRRDHDDGVFQIRRRYRVHHRRCRQRAGRRIAREPDRHRAVAARGNDKAAECDVGDARIGIDARNGPLRAMHCHRGQRAAQRFRIQRRHRFSVQPIDQRQAAQHAIAIRRKIERAGSRAGRFQQGQRPRSITIGLHIEERIARAVGGDLRFAHDAVVAGIVAQSETGDGFDAGQGFAERLVRGHHRVKRFARGVVRGIGRQLRCEALRRRRIARIQRKGIDNDRRARLLQRLGGAGERVGRPWPAAVFFDRLFVEGECAHMIMTAPDRIGVRARVLLLIDIIFEAGEPRGRAAQIEREDRRRQCQKAKRQRPDRVGICPAAHESPEQVLRQSVRSAQRPPVNHILWRRTG